MVKTMASSAMVLFLLGSSDAMTTFLRRGTNNNRRSGAFIRPFLLGGIGGDEHYNHHYFLQAQGRKRAHKKLDQALTLMKEEQTDVPITTRYGSTAAAVAAPPANDPNKLLQMLSEAQRNNNNNKAEIELQFSSAGKFSGKLIAKGFSPEELQKFGQTISLYYVLPLCLLSLLVYCLFRV